MKVALIQPPYSTDYTKIEDYFNWEMKMLDACDDSLDLILLPESADVPCYADSIEKSEDAFRRFTVPLIEKCRETARRARALVFFNADDYQDGMHLNTTYAMNREGEIVFRYYKQHPTPGEVAKRKINHGYALSYNEAPTVEIEGIRFAFLTCYDFYFYENCGQIARTKPDIIIGCSHQRTDKQSALRMMSAFYAYNCNAFVLRSSVSISPESTIGGGTMAVSPDGTILLDMESRTGMETLVIDPHEKYLKPAGFQCPLSSHADYVEKGRRPWKYRPAGPFVKPYDNMMGFPRLCAHRGYSAVLPENSMGAYGAAVALGAEEIEFDLRETKDGVVVAFHYGEVDEYTNGTGLVKEMTFREIKALSIEVGGNTALSGMKIPTFEEILQEFACRVVMNIHLKVESFEKDRLEIFLKKVLSLIDRYDCRRYVYFMTTRPSAHQILERLAPDIPRCMGAGEDHFTIVERGIEKGCKRVQFWAPDFTQEMVDKAHAHGIICNVFFADEPEEIRRYLDMGCDVILTNNYLVAKRTLEEWKAGK